MLRLKENDAYERLFVVLDHNPDNFLNRLNLEDDENLAKPLNKLFTFEGLRHCNKTFSKDDIEVALLLELEHVSEDDVFNLNEFLEE